MAHLLSYIELDRDRPTPHSLAVLKQGRALATEFGATLCAVVPCAEAPGYRRDDFIAAISRYGADTIVLITGASLAGPPLYPAHCAALRAACERYSPLLVILPNGASGDAIAAPLALAIGGHLAPDVQLYSIASTQRHCVRQGASEEPPEPTCGRRGGTAASNAVSRNGSQSMRCWSEVPSDALLSPDGGGHAIAYSRWVFQRQRAATASLRHSPRPLVLTLSPLWPAVPPSIYEEAEVVVLEAPGDSPPPWRIEAVVSSSALVLGGGAELRDREGFRLLQRLGERLGAPVVASHTACRRGMAPAELEIGKACGCVARPLYVAFGIAGSPRHLAAISAQTAVVAVSADDRAPIHRTARCSIVADARATIEGMLRELDETDATGGQEPARLGSSGLGEG